MLFFTLHLTAQTISTYVEEPPVIDGLLDDEVWEKSAQVTGFKSFVPDFRQDMPFKTIAYMAHDDENLYFAFKCYDDPTKIKTSIAARDKIRDDDWVCINMDSFNDKQTLYGFYVNPNGIQMDSRFAAGKDDDGVDVIWYSKGVIDDEGYTVEVRIPFKSIRYAMDKGEVNMGLIFERKISRFSMQGTFPVLDPAQGFNFLTQTLPVQYYDVKKSTLLELLPAVTYAKNKVHEAGDFENSDNFEPSLTLKYGITSDLILDATINPDFSQVEADASQVEVNQRFAVNYPERRPFFLEGNENFNFAGNSFNAPVRQVVNTRSIVSPTAAIKLTGKAGKKNTLSTILAVDRENSNDSDVADLAGRAVVGVLRYKRTFANDSYLGLIGTGRYRDNSENLVYGADGQYRMDGANLLSGNYLTSLTQETGGPTVSKEAYNLNFRHETRKQSISVNYATIDDGFRSDVGYVTRTGVSKLAVSYSPKFYPEKGVIKKIDNTLYYANTKDRPSGLHEYSYYTSVSFTLPRSSKIQLSGNKANEIFEARKFDRSSLSVRANSQITKRINFNTEYRINRGTYYTGATQGYGKRINGRLILQLSDKFNAEVSYVYSDLNDKESREEYYHINIARGKFTYQMNQYLFFRVVTQYNSLSKVFAPNFLASFTLIPGTVVHLGYGSVYERVRWDGVDYVENDQFLETNRGLFFKASYLFRL